MITTDENKSNIISLYPITTQFHIPTIERLSFGPQDTKSGLMAMPEGTEKKAKERQGRNWPGKIFVT